MKEYLSFKFQFNFFQFFFYLIFSLLEISNLLFFGYFFQLPNLKNYKIIEMILQKIEN